MWRRQKYLAALLVGIVVSLASGAPQLRINGLDAAVPLKVEGKDELVISVAGADDIDEQGYSVICQDRGRLEPVSGPSEVFDGNAATYRFVFDDEWELGTVSLIADQNMVIDGIAITAGAEIYKLHLCYSLQADTTTAIGVDFESLSWVAPEPQVEQAAESEDSISDSEAQSPLVDEPATPIERPRELAEKVLLESPCGVDATVCMLRGSYESLSLAGKDKIIAERTNWLRTGDMPEGTRSVIEISSDITSNQIWTGDNTYHVTADVNVQALLVIEPGAIVEFAADKAMFVNNGGTLISVGRPGNPVVYTSDSGTPAYNDYYCPLYIESTASSNTKIVYSHVEYAYIGVMVVDNELDVDICDNYFYNNAYGIVEFGPRHTDIRNNLVFESYYSGIEVFLGDTGGQGSAESKISIKNNTCDYYQDNGITIHGVADGNDAGLVVLTNNIVSGSYVYGIAIVDGYMYSIVTNTGYYGNASNKNWAFDEYYPVIETSWPYMEGSDWMPMCYLRQNCDFINAGYEYIEETALIGKTTDVNSFPDSNLTDIGFHYPNWGFSNAGDSNSLPADFDGSMKVDFRDFATFANAWQQTTEEPEDLDGSGFVDYNDLSIFCDQWLDTLSLGVTLNHDPNLVSDVLVLTLVGSSDNTTCYLFIDGQYFGTFYGDNMEIPTYEYRNGDHEIKVVGVSLDDTVLVGQTINTAVSNRLYCLTGSEAYRYNQAYQFAGFYEPNDSSTINFTIKDLDESVIWTNSSIGNFNFIVSAGVLQSPYNSLTIQEVAGSKSGDAGWKSWIKDITKEFDVTSDPNAANARSLLVGVKKGFIGIGDWTYNRREVWKEYLNACQKKSLDPTICLFFSQATRENIKTAFGLSNVKSIMIITDGRRDWNGVHRTSFAAWDGPYFSYLRRNWGGAPSEYEPLPDKYEERGYSVSDQINSFHSRNKMYVFIDACKNGTSCMPASWFETLGITEPDDNNYSWDEYYKTSDMARAFDIYPGTLETRLYMGWRGFAFKGNPLTKYNNFLETIWWHVGNTGSSSYKRFDAAISYAATCDYGNRIPAANFSYVGNVEIYFGQ